MRTILKIVNRKGGLIIVTLCIITLAIIYFRFNPLSSIYFPKCPFLSLKGYDCPGCGSQRAVHYLLHFDLTNALKVNALFVIAIPYIILGAYFEYFGGKTRYPNTRKALFGVKACILALVIIIAFWIGRNII